MGSGIQSIYWDDRCVRVINHSSAAKGKVAVVRVELSVSDPHELGDLLRQLMVLRNQPAAPARHDEANS